MSYEFDAATDYISAGTRSMPTAAGTLALWVRPTWAQTDGVNHFYFNQTTDTNNYFQFLKWSDNNVYVGWKAAGTDYRVVVTTYTQNQNAWNVWVVTWDDTANTTIARLNGTQVGSNSSLATVSLTGTTRFLGSYDTAASFNDVRGRLAEVAIWNVVLSASQIAAVEARISPFRVAAQSLENYWPMRGNAVDLGLNPTNLTLNSVAVADHAPIGLLRPRRRMVGYAPGAAPANPWPGFRLESDQGIYPARMPWAAVG